MSMLMTIKYAAPIHITPRWGYKYDAPTELTILDNVLCRNEVLYLFKRLCNKMISVSDFFGKANMIFEFIPEMANCCCYRPCGCITKRANRIPFDFSLDVPKQIDIFFTAVAGFNSV